MHLFKFFLFSPDNFFVDDFARFSALDSRGKTAAIANSMNYLTKKGKTFGLVLDPTYLFFYLVLENITPSYCPEKKDSIVPFINFLL